MLGDGADEAPARREPQPLRQSGARASEEGDEKIEIPAFLRRQAN